MITEQVAQTTRKEICFHPLHRHDLGEWLNSWGLDGEGCEIGVLHGSFSKIIMSKWNGSTLHLVDPWIEQDPGVYRESLNYSQDWNKAYKETLGKMVEYSSRVKIHRMFSVDAARKFSDGQLDFVYIDGNHAYEAVMSDLLAWWPKVKRGGLFGGHDYENKIGDGKHCEVKKAVDQFMESLGRSKVDATPCSSWWAIKGL